MNTKEMAEHLGIEESDYLELLEVLFETGNHDLSRLQDAIDQRDADQAVKAAHSLKGAAANLGLMELSEASREVEEKARLNKMDEVADSAEVLRGNFEQIAELIRD